MPSRTLLAITSDPPAQPDPGQAPDPMDDGQAATFPPAAPVGLAVVPEEGSILSFTTDDRYTMVHFGGVKEGDTQPTIFSYPFLGWAVQVRNVNLDKGVCHTNLVPVGLGEDGAPVTAWDLETFDDIPGAYVNSIEPRDPAHGGGRPAT